MNTRLDFYWLPNVRFLCLVRVSGSIKHKTNPDLWQGGVSRPSKAGFSALGCKNTFAHTREPCRPASIWTPHHPELVLHWHNVVHCCIDWVLFTCVCVCVWDEATLFLDSTSERAFYLHSGEMSQIHPGPVFVPWCHFRSGSLHTLHTHTVCIICRANKWSKARVNLPCEGIHAELGDFRRW